MCLNLGEKIRNAREDMDLSQKEVSRLIPMNQSNYSKIERDLQEPNMDQLKRICEILKLDPRYLLELEKHEVDSTNILSAEDIQLITDFKAFVKKYNNIIK